MKLSKMFLLIACFLVYCPSNDAVRRKKDEAKGLAGILQDNERVIGGLQFAAEHISSVPVGNNRHVKLFQYPTQIIDTTDSREPINEKLKNSRSEIFAFLSQKVGRGQHHFFYRSAVDDSDDLDRYSWAIKKTARELQAHKKKQSSYTAFIQITNGDKLPQEVVLIHQEPDGHRNYIALLIRKENQPDKNITLPGGLCAQFVLSIEEAMNTTQQEQRMQAEADPA